MSVIFSAPGGAPWVGSTAAVLQRLVPGTNLSGIARPLKAPGRSGSGEYLETLANERRRWWSHLRIFPGGRFLHPIIYGFDALNIPDGIYDAETFCDDYGDALRMSYMGQPTENGEPLWKGYFNLWWQGGSPPAYVTYGGASPVYVGSDVGLSPLFDRGTVRWWWSRTKGYAPITVDELPPRYFHEPTQTEFLQFTEPIFTKNIGIWDIGRQAPGILQVLASDGFGARDIFLDNPPNYNTHFGWFSYWRGRMPPTPSTGYRAIGRCRDFLGYLPRVTSHYRSYPLFSCDWPRLASFDPAAWWVVGLYTKGTPQYHFTGDTNLIEQEEAIYHVGSETLRSDYDVYGLPGSGFWVPEVERWDFKKDWNIARQSDFITHAGEIPIFDAYWMHGENRMAPGQVSLELTNSPYQPTPLAAGAKRESGVLKGPWEQFSVRRIYIYLIFVRLQEEVGANDPLISTRRNMAELHLKLDSPGVVIHGGVSMEMLGTMFSY